MDTASAVHPLNFNVLLGLPCDKGFTSVRKKAEFLEKSSINIDILPVFSDRTEVHSEFLKEPVKSRFVSRLSIGTKVLSYYIYIAMIYNVTSLKCRCYIIPLVFMLY